MIATVSQFHEWVTGQPVDLTGEISSVCIDSRQVAAGSVFVAMQGDRADGHSYIGQALNHGAALVIAEKNNEYADAFSNCDRVVFVGNSLEALQTAALQYRRTFDIPVIGITGTNGKTTTKELVAAVLNQKYNVAVNPGNFNNHLGVPLSIFQWQREADLAVVEMGTNHFGEIATLCRIAQPTHGLITNIGKGHLEFLIDEDGVARAKAELLESLNQHGTAFLNMDDSRLRARKLMVKQTIGFGIDSEADIKGLLEGPDQQGYYSLLIDRFHIGVPILGRHNGYNVLAAVAVGLHFGVGLNQIKHAVEGFESVKQRMQVLEIGGMTVLNDAYNANPSSMEASVRTLAQYPSQGRRVAVLGDMAELGTAATDGHRHIGRVAAQSGIDRLLCLGPNMAEAVNEAERQGFGSAAHFESFESLMAALEEELKPGDVVLVKGSRSMALDRVSDGLSRLRNQ